MLYVKELIYNSLLHSLWWIPPLRWRISFSDGFPFLYAYVSPGGMINVLVLESLLNDFLFNCEWLHKCQFCAIRIQCITYNTILLNQKIERWSSPYFGLYIWSPYFFLGGIIFYFPNNRLMSSKLWSLNSLRTSALLEYLNIVIGIVLTPATF